MGYAKTTFSAVYSTSSDYSLPQAQTSAIQVESTPVTYFNQVVTVPAGTKKTPGHVFDLTPGALNVTPSSIVVRNADAEYSINVSWYSKRADLTGWNGGDIYVRDTYTNSTYNTVTHVFRDSAEPEVSYFENLHMGDILIADVSDHTGIVADEGEDPLEWVFVGFGDTSTATDYHNIILARPYESIATGLTASEQQDNSLTKFTHLNHNSHDIGPGQFLHLPGNLYDSAKSEFTISGINNACVVEVFALEASA